VRSHRAFGAATADLAGRRRLHVLDDGFGQACRPIASAGARSAEATPDYRAIIAGWVN
jgi:hypothetical protein